MTLLRDGRGRIRCYFDECNHWASHLRLLPTPTSVAATVPLCQCCIYSQYFNQCEGA